MRWATPKHERAREPWCAFEEELLEYQKFRWFQFLIYKKMQNSGKD